MLISSCQMYKMDTQQGNFLETEKIAKLKTDLTKKQVQDLLGTPALVPMLNLDRWDYYYSYKPGDNSLKSEENLLSLFFKNNRLVSYSGEYTINTLTRKST